jgi:RNA polymerase sigma-70 factor (ECF subfamily)
MYTYAYFRLGDTEAAKDLVQEVFTDVWRQLPRFENRHPGAFPGWLFRIGHNGVVDRLRHRRFRVVDLEEGRDGAVEFEGEAISRRLVIELLERLPALQREVVVLRFIAGMSLAEVAGALGKREGAVVQLQLRGLRRMRKELEKE